MENYVDRIWLNTNLLYNVMQFIFHKLIHCNKIRALKRRQRSISQKQRKRKAGGRKYKGGGCNLRQEYAGRQ